MTEYEKLMLDLIVAVLHQLDAMRTGDCSDVFTLQLRELATRAEDLLQEQG